jgi:multidrug efflux pump
MSLSSPFIKRPVGTTLLTVAVAIAGGIAFMVLPVAPLPQVDFPTISVSAGLPGASAQIMAASVATPLERQFSHIAGITEMTSSSSLGSCSVTLPATCRRPSTRPALICPRTCPRILPIARSIPPTRPS